MQFIQYPEMCQRFENRANSTEDGHLKMMMVIIIIMIMMIIIITVMITIILLLVINKQINKK